jgi:hypothetical protein
MIISTVSINDFHNAFAAMRPDNFTYDALDALYFYYDDVSNDMDEPFELDVVAICCEWCEYASFEDLQSDYKGINDMDDLTDQAHVIELDNGGLVLQTF